MNIYHLRYFITLAHTEHYTRAAKMLDITQPSLSHAIAALEDELGISLFEKSGRNIALTKGGRIFLEDAERLIDSLDTSVHKIQRYSDGFGTIELGFLRALGISYIPNLVDKFMNTYGREKVRFHFHNALSNELLAGLKSEKYDIVFCSKMSNDENLEYIPIARQELILAVPENHPLAAYDSIDLSETLKYPQIYFSRSSGLRPVIDDLFRQIDATPNVAMEIDEDEVIAGFVAKGFGIAVIPNIQILEILPVKALHITNPVWERMFYMVCLKDSYMLPIVKNFRQFVLENTILDLHA